MLSRSYPKEKKISRSPSSSFSSRHPSAYVYMVHFFRSSLLLLLFVSLRHCHYGSNSLLVAAASTAKGNVGSSNVLISSGLVNLGNTCYLNSQLQCAYHIPAVRNLVKNPTGLSDSSSNYIALRSLQAVFSSMEAASSSEEKKIYKTRAASTLPLCRNLGINVYEQQDSQEFWKLLLPELEFPSLVDLYQGAYEGYIAALDGSGRERKRQEIFLDLSLDISSSDNVLDSMERMFCEPEILNEKEEGNGWRPEKGAEKVDALKGSSLYAAGLPSILQLHLMRFSYDWQTDSMSKINDQFSFPKELNLSEICKDVSKDETQHSIFDLQSIVVHKGRYGSGHYYSYVRPDVTRNTWFRFDDDRVTRVTFKEVKADAFGGENIVKKKNQKRSGFWKRLLSSDGSNYGWGGKDSSAYMLQYVRRIDIPKLYNTNK